MMKRVGSMLVTAVVLSACSESTVLTGTNEKAQIAPPSASQENVLAEVSCKVDVAANKMTCGPVGPNLAAGVSADVILGGQNTYVKLTSALVAIPGDSIAANVTVQNLTVQSWGTADGTTQTANGVQVFFHTGPTNGVVVANPDLTATFTAPNQPAFQYSGAALGADGILTRTTGTTAGETSSAKTWKFGKNGALTFAFTVLIKTATPDDTGILRWTRSVLPKTAGSESKNAVWGSSATDVWAGGTAGTTSLQRWDGSVWNPVASTSGADILGLWGTAANNVYAVGSTKIQRFTGTSWADIPSGATGGLLAIWGSSATNIYAGGLGGNLVQSTNGTSFAAVPSTGLTGTDNVAAIWGSSASDVYIGGSVVRRYDGANWNAVSAGITGVRGIWGSSSTDIWMVGTLGQVSHLTGGIWVTSTLGSTSTDFSGIWGTAANDIYAVKRDGQTWHYNGTSWDLFASSNTVLTSVWGSGHADVWTVGTNTGFTDNILVRGTR